MLTTEELQALEGDLKAFLIINGVDGDTWKSINEQEPEKALDLVELFSDTVLQTVYEKLEFLEFRIEDSCLVFRCLSEEMVLISISKKEGSTLNLSTIDGIHDALSKHAKELTVFKSQKPYRENREAEIHQLISQGCFVSSVEFWQSLEEIL